MRQEYEAYRMRLIRGEMLAGEALRLLRLLWDCQWESHSVTSVANFFHSVGHASPSKLRPTIRTNKLRSPAPTIRCHEQASFHIVLHLRPARLVAFS